MSTWRDQFGDEEEMEAFVDWMDSYYHILLLILLVGFAFWNRVRNYSNFMQDGEILFSGNDPWYQARSTRYVVENFPETMPFDPWTNFPYGTFTGQFGTIYDQFIALTGLIVGLGNPDETTVGFVLLIAPAFVAALICVPLYFIGRRFGGRASGLVAVAFVAFAPDRLLEVSLAGNAQHHGAEVLGMGITVLGLMVALRAAEKELPVFELVLAREFSEIRNTIVWSMLAGFALALYLWVWPPAIWMFGIIGIFFVIHMSAEHLRGRSPEHTAFVGAITLATAGLLQLGNVRTFELGIAQRGILQPGLGILVALGVVFLAWLSRELHSREYSRTAYPLTIGGSIVGAGVVMALVAPGLFEFFFDQYDRVFGASVDWVNSIVWFIDIQQEAGALATIGEGSPGSIDEITGMYHFATFTAFFGAVVLVVKQVLDERPKGEELLILIWGIFMVVATLTQIRFGYYLILLIGALNASLVGYVLQLAGTPDRDSVPETYQILTIVVVIIVMFVPMLGVPLIGAETTAIDTADRGSQPGSVVGWSDSLDWMAENTPQPGQYGNPDGEAMDYYGQFSLTDDFEYKDGAYGVLSWWDYGHWILGKGERIANANPFQQNADPAAEFLVAQSEDEGLSVLESEFSDSEQAQTQYVMIDALMIETNTNIGGKFFAPPAFDEDSEGADYYRTMFSETGFVGTVQTQDYYESMMIRLYRNHGSAVDPEPFVVQWDGQVQRDSAGRGFVSVPENRTAQPIVQFYDNISAAQAAAEEDPSSQVGGIGPHPEESVEALDHFRLVHTDEVPAVPRVGGDDRAWQNAVQRGLTRGPAVSAFQQNLPLLQNAEATSNSTNRPGTEQERLDYLYDTTPAFTKTFERVPGATIEGSVAEDANASVGEGVTISVPIDPPSGEDFTYTQRAELDENLEFTATVPYSTTGYDEYGVEEGYTNVSARATGPYTIQTPREFDSDQQAFVFNKATVNVTEGQVIGEEDPTVEVVLEEETQEINFEGGGGS